MCTCRESHRERIKFCPFCLNSLSSLHICRVNSFEFGAESSGHCSADRRDLQRDCGKKSSLAQLQNSSPWSTSLIFVFLCICIPAGITVCRCPNYVFVNGCWLATCIVVPRTCTKQNWMWISTANEERMWWCIILNVHTVVAGCQRYEWAAWTINSQIPSC